MRFRELVFPLWHHIMITHWQLLSTSLACILLSSLESLIEDTYLSEAFNHIWYVMQCRGPVASGSEVLLNLKYMCSAIHLLQYIEIRAYLIPKVFHQQDLIRTLEWRGASLHPIDPWEVCSPPYIGYGKTGLSWHPFYFLPSTSATPDFRCLVGPTACTNLCLPRVSALVNLTVKSPRLTLK